MKAASALLILGAAAAVSAQDDCTSAMGSAQGAGCMSEDFNPSVACGDTCVGLATTMATACAVEQPEMATGAAGILTACAAMNNPCTAALMTEDAQACLPGDDGDMDMEKMCTDSCKGTLANIVTQCEDYAADMGMEEMMEGLSQMGLMCTPCGQLMMGPNSEQCFPDDDADPTADNCSDDCMTFFVDAASQCAGLDGPAAEAAVGAGLMQVACTALSGGAGDIPECATCSEVPTGTCDEIQEMAFGMMEGDGCLSTCTDDELTQLMEFLAAANMIDAKCVAPIAAALEEKKEGNGDSAISPAGVAAGVAAAAAAAMFLA